MDEGLKSHPALQNSDVNRGHEPFLIASFISNELRVRFMERAPLGWWPRIATVNCAVAIVALASWSAAVLRRFSIGPARQTGATLSSRNQRQRRSGVSPDWRARQREQSRVVHRRLRRERQAGRLPYVEVHGEPDSNALGTMRILPFLDQIQYCQAA